MRAAETGLLLLCCALGEAVKPLTGTEFEQLSRCMAAHPAPWEELLRVRTLTARGIEPEQARRIVSLLERRDALERYLSEPGVTAVTRISEGFPQRLRALGAECPPVLFCRGDVSLLTRRCIALVGARTASPRNLAFAEHIGTLAAREGFTLVSGGAAGADSAAQNACLRAGGSVVCFVPDALRRYPERERVLYCADEGYELPFSSVRALRRNHFIHALGEKAFVAQCDAQRGGSRSGAADNLRRGLSPVFVLDDGSEGAVALVRLGAQTVSDRPSSLAALAPAQLSIFD